MKKILIAVMIIVSALCLSGCGGPAPAQDNAYLKLLKEGDKALAEGNIEDALTAYMSALEMDPSAPQAPHRIFDTYVRDERFDDAIQFALDNYQSIATEMPEGSDVPYESEGSTYSGMTARQELAAFYSSAMDVSLHRRAALDNSYPEFKVADFVEYVCDNQQTAESEDLTNACKDYREIRDQYADLLSRMSEAGFLFDKDLEELEKNQQELYYMERDPRIRLIKEPEPDSLSQVIEYSFPASIISMETAAAFEEELRGILAKDPDLIFIYYDIARLYIQAGRRDLAESVYEEAVQALKDMYSRRGYISNVTPSLYAKRFSNLYYLGYYAVVGESGVLKGDDRWYPYRFYYLGMGASKDRPTVEQCQEAFDAAYKETDELPLSDREKKDIELSHKSYTDRLSRCIGAAEGVEDDSKTQTEGDADRVFLGGMPYFPDAFLPESGWMKVTYGGNHSKMDYIGEFSVLINLYTGKIIEEEDLNSIMNMPWRLSENNVITFEVRESETGERASLTSYEKTRTLYMIVSDLNGNVLEERPILEAEGNSIDSTKVEGDGGYTIYYDEDQLAAFKEEVISATEEALSEYPEYENGDEWEEIHPAVEDGRVVFEVAGVKFSRALSDAKGYGAEDSVGYVRDDFVMLNWKGYSYGTEIFRLK